MNNHPIEWEVKMYLIGPISLYGSSIDMEVQKGIIDPFLTNLQMKELKLGLEMSLDARGRTQKDANDAALFFIGQAIDLLTLRTDLPYSLSQSKFDNINKEFLTKRKVHHDYWAEIFQLSREYGINRPTFSRALSWYRKAIITEDPIDSFFAFWLSMETIASTRARENERTSKGIINKMCDCFDQLWKSSDDWEVIPGKPKEINRLYDLRNNIAHGAIPVQVDALHEVSEELDLIRELSHAFLTSWEQHHEQNAP